jgi:quercetin dioxygenase-like cupin family protein
MLKSAPFEIGDLRGTVFTLEKAGDIFPVHTHGENDIHITIVAFGSVRCTGRPEIEGKILEAKPGGTLIDWKAGEPHGFVALSDGATLVNIIKQ